MTHAEILDKLRAVMAESFQLDPEQIKPESHLFTDLGLDSIDGVDLAIQLQDITGKRVNAADFKGVRTVQDVVDTVHKMLQEA